MVRRLTGNQRFLMWMVFVVLSGSLVYFLWFSPQGYARDEMAEELRYAEMELARLEAAVKTLPVLQLQRDEVAELVPGLRTAVALEPLTPEVLAQISGTARAHDVRLPSVSLNPGSRASGKDDETELSHGTMSVGLTMEGTYEGINHVVNDLQAWSRILIIDSLSLSVAREGTDPRITVAIGARAFILRGAIE